MASEKHSYLSAIDVFRDLSPAEVADIERTITMSACHTGRVFFTPAESGEVLFLLKKGKVQLYRLSPEGKKQVVVTLDAGAVFGEMALVGQGMHGALAEALEESLICVMSREDVERIIRWKPVVALRFIEAMGRRLHEAESRLEEIAFKNIPARLASVLLRLADEMGDGRAVEGYTHQDLAEMLGTYRETATQTLNSFKQHGLIELGRKRVVILNREGLEAAAEG